MNNYAWGRKTYETDNFRYVKKPNYSKNPVIESKFKIGIEKMNCTAIKYLELNPRGVICYETSKVVGRVPLGKDIDYLLSHIAGKDGEMRKQVLKELVGRLEEEMPGYRGI